MATEKLVKRRWGWMIDPEPIRCPCGVLESSLCWKHGAGKEGSPMIWRHHSRVVRGRCVRCRTLVDLG